MLILPTTGIVDHTPRIGSSKGESVPPLCSGGEFAYTRFVLGSERPRVFLCHDNLLDLSVAAERFCANNLANWARPSPPATATPPGCRHVDECHGFVWLSPVPT